MSNLLKKLFAVLALVVLIFIAYLAFGRDSTGGALLTSTDGADISAIDLETNRIINRIEEIEMYDVAGTLFSNPVFTSLKDMRTVLDEEPTGRPNPFAPLR